MERGCEWLYVPLKHSATTSRDVAMRVSQYQAQIDNRKTRPSPEIVRVIHNVMRLTGELAQLSNYEQILKPPSLWPVIISSSAARASAAARCAVQSALANLRSPRTMEWTNKEWMNHGVEWDQDCPEVIKAKNDSWKVKLGNKFQENGKWEEYQDNVKKTDTWFFNEMKKFQYGTEEAPAIGGTRPWIDKRQTWNSSLEHLRAADEADATELLQAMRDPSWRPPTDDEMNGGEEAPAPWAPSVDQGGMSSISATRRTMDSNQSHG